MEIFLARKFMVTVGPLSRATIPLQIRLYRPRHIFTYWLCHRAYW